MILKIYLRNHICGLCGEDIYLVQDRGDRKAYLICKCEKGIFRVPLSHLNDHREKYELCHIWEVHY